MLNLLKIWLSVVLTVMLTLTACSDDTSGELLPDDEEAYGGSVSLHFHLRLSDGGVSGVSLSRADMSTPGTNRENAVNTICLFIYDADSNELVDDIYLTEGQVTAIQSSVGLVVPISARKGQEVYIYAVANPTEGMRRAFSLGGNVKDIFFASTRSDYWDVIEEFVPDSGGHQVALENSDTGAIPMTGIFKEDGADGDVITIPDGDTVDDVPLKVTAEVSRVVAKVHMLVVSKTYNIDGEDLVYVNAVDISAGDKQTDGKAEDYSGWIGWIRLSDVRYMPNGINKSTYIFPHVNGAGGLMDCNMNLADYVGNGEFDSRLYDRDFVYYDGLSLHEVNVVTPDNFAQAEAFDQSRLDKTIGTDAPDRYTRGMYCPENYFDTPAEMDFYNVQKNAIPMVTHLSIATRLVPKDLLVLTDFPEKLDAFFKAAKEAGFSNSFYKSYGITKDDINLEEDAKLWESIKKDYFGEDYTRKDPVDNEKYGLSQVFRKDFYMFSSRNIKEANSFINWSLVVRRLWSGDDKEFSDSKYPKNTYYVYDTKYDGVSSWSETGRKYVYLVAGAVALADGDNIGIKLYSVPHVGGWGYYYTYIDNNNSTVGGLTPFTASQVTRNTYYLVTVNNFGTPGGTITDPEYIRVNTEPVNWDYGGRGDINLH